MASDKICCVLECKKSREDGAILHKFPNPVEDPTRFQTWLQAVGGNLKDLDDMYVFKYRRICRTHFESRYWTRSKMLSNIAIPTLQMTGVPETPDRESSCQSALPSTVIPMTDRLEFGMEDRVNPSTIPIETGTKCDNAVAILTPVLKEHNYYREKPVKPRHENLTKKYSPRFYSRSSQVIRMRTQIKQMRNEICRLNKRCLRLENARKLSKSAQNSKPFCSKCLHCQQQNL